MATDRAELLYKAVKQKALGIEQLRDDDKALLKQYMDMRMPAVSQVTGEEGLPPIPQPSGAPGLIERGLSGLRQGYEARAQSNLEKMAQSQGITPQQLLSQAQQNYTQLPKPVQQFGLGAASGIVPKLTMPEYARQQLAEAPQPEGIMQKAARSVGEIGSNLPIYSAVGGLIGAPAASAALKNLPAKTAIGKAALGGAAAGAATVGATEAVRQAADMATGVDKSIEDLVRAVGTATVLGGAFGAGAGVLSWYVPQLITTYRTNRDLNTYRKILGVGKDATPQEIKAAYRKRSLSVHPDHNPSPEAKAQFDKLNQARDILTHWKLIDKVLYDAGAAPPAPAPPVFDPSRPVPALRQPTPSIPSMPSVAGIAPRPMDVPVPIGRTQPPALPAGEEGLDLPAVIEAVRKALPEYSGQGASVPTGARLIPTRVKGRMTQGKGDAKEQTSGFLLQYLGGKEPVPGEPQPMIGLQRKSILEQLAEAAQQKPAIPTATAQPVPELPRQIIETPLPQPETVAAPVAQAKPTEVTRQPQVSAPIETATRTPITKEMPVEQKVVSAGFRDVNEATMAFEAKSLGKDKFLKSFGEIDKKMLGKYFPKMKPEQIYDSLAQKVDSLDKETQDIVAMDLQLFGGGQKFTDEQRKAIRKMIDTTKSLDLKHLRPEYREKVEGLLGEVDWKVMYRTQRRMDRMQATADFLKEHPENSIPDDVLAELKLLDKKQLSEMSFDEIKTMFDAVKHAVKLNALKNRLTIGKNLIEAKKVVGEAQQAIVKAHPEVADRDAKLIDGMAQYSVAPPIKRVFTSDTLQPETIVQMLQGTDEGPLSKFLYDGIDKGVSEQLRYYYDTQDAIRKAIGSTDVRGWSRAFNLKAKNVITVSIPVSEGRTLKITPDQRMEIYAHTLNPKNKASLLEGGIIFSDRQGQAFKLMKEDVGAVVESMTSDEKRVIDAMLQHLDSVQKKAINDVSVKLLGYEIATEPDYWPIKRSWYSMEQDPLKSKKVFSRRTLEGMGFLKERTGARLPLVIRGAFSTFYESISNAGAYSGLAEPLRNAKLLLQDADMIHSIRERGLGHYVDALNRYVEDVEAGSGILDNVESALRQLLVKIQGGILGFNPGIVAKQPVSYLGAAAEMDWKYLQRALFSKPDWAEITKHSSQMRHRVEGKINRETGELGEVGKVLQFYTGRTFLSQKFTEGITRADLATVGRIWNAVKLEIADKFPDLKGDAFFEKVAERTDLIINRTQPSGLPHTLSGIGRSKSFATRAATVFSTQRNKNVNMAYTAWRRYEQSGRTAQDKVDFLKRMFLMVAAAPATVTAVDILRDKLYQRKPTEEPVSDFMWRTFTNVIGNLYFVGPAFTALMSKVKRGTFAGFDIEDPVTSTANEVVDSISKVFVALDQLKTQERFKSGDKRYELKWKDTAMKAIDSTLKVVAKTQGIPYGNVKNIIDAMIRAGENEKRATR